MILKLTLTHKLLITLCALVQFIYATERIPQPLVNPFRYQHNNTFEASIPVHNTRIYIFNRQSNQFLNCNLQGVQDTGDYWTIIDTGNRQYVFMCRDGYYLGETTTNSQSIPSKEALIQNNKWVQFFYSQSDEVFCLKNSQSNQYLSMEGTNSLISPTCGNNEQFSLMKNLNPIKEINRNHHEAIYPNNDYKVFIYSPHFGKFINCQLQTVPQTTDYWTIHTNNLDEYSFECSNTNNNNKWLSGYHHVPRIEPYDSYLEKWVIHQVPSLNQVFCFKNTIFQTNIGLAPDESVVMTNQCTQNEQLQFFNTNKLPIDIHRGATFFMKSISHNRYIVSNYQSLSSLKRQYYQMKFWQREDNTHQIQAIDSDQYLYLSIDGSFKPNGQLTQADKDRSYMKIEYLATNPNLICIKSKSTNKYLKSVKSDSCTCCYQFSFEDANDCSNEVAFELS